MAWPTFWNTPMCCHAIFGGSRSNRVRIRREENLQNWGSLGPRRLGLEGVAGRLAHLHARFGCSPLKRVVIENPKSWGALVHRPLAVGTRMTPRNTPSPPVILPNLVVIGQMVRALLSISTWKSWPLATRLSRLLKVIGTDTHRSATYDFLLMFHSNHGPIVAFPR